MKKIPFLRTVNLRESDTGPLQRGRPRGARMVRLLA